MSRILVFTLVTSLAGSSVALAGESLIESAARIAQTQSASNDATSTGGRAAVAMKRPATLFEQGQQVLSKSGLKTRTKVMILAALGAGFAASVWKIDHSVLDVTPSSLGTRQDK